MSYNPFSNGDESSDLDQAKGLFDPWLEQGRSSLSLLSKLFPQLISNPSGLEDQIMGKYQESPEAQYQSKTLTDSMNRQAAMSGELGSPNEQAGLASNLQGIVGRDQQQYLQNAMAPYNMAVGGEQTMSSQGLKAATAESLIDQLQAALSGQQSGEFMNLLGSMGGGLAKLLMGHLGAGIGNTLGAASAAEGGGF